MVQHELESVDVETSSPMAYGTLYRCVPDSVVRKVMYCPRMCSQRLDEPPRADLSWYAIFANVDLLSTLSPATVATVAV